MDLNDIEYMNVLKRHKKKEKAEREVRIEEVQQKINGLKKKILQVDVSESTAAMKKFKLRIAIVEECEL